MTLSNALNWFLLLYLPVFLAAAFLWRSIRVWQTTGINPYRMRDSQGAERITAGYFRILPALSVMVVVMHGWWPAIYANLGRIEVLEQPAPLALGILLMLLALGLVIRAEADMGNAWRIGLDQDNPTPLIQHGVFRYSRNPVFVAIIGSATGLFLVLPNAVTLVILVLDIALIQVQVSLEETFLLDMHGQDYAHFCTRVRRWL